MAINTGGISWGTDTDVSMPEPLAADRQALIDMGGFCFTMKGIAHDFNETDREIFLMPTFVPEPHGLAGEVFE